MTTVESILEHHGVKGQKWGIRKDHGHQGQRVTQKKLAKLDQKFLGQRSADVWVRIHNGAADRANGPGGSIETINNKWKGKIGKPGSPSYTAYYKEMQKAFLEEVKASAKDIGPSASGRFEVGIVDNGDFNNWGIVVKDRQLNHTSLAHSDLTIQIKFNRDANGLITSVEIVDAVAHTDEVGNFLEHHGVKGQKWGVRNKKKRVTSADFKSTKSLRQRHPHELTNEEIKKINERMNLEQSYKKLNPSKADIGHAKVKKFLAIIGTVGTLVSLSQTPAGKHFLSVGKKVVEKKPPIATKSADLIVKNLGRTLK